MSLYREIALPLARRGVPTIPLRPKTKEAFMPGWQQSATTDTDQIEAWDILYPNSNAGSVAKGELGKFWFLELDDQNLPAQIKADTGNPLPLTFCVRSSPGHGHLYFKQTPASLAMGNITQPYVKDKNFSVRVNNEYVVAPGSWHPTSGKQYEVVSDNDIVEAPEWLIEWIIRQRIDSGEAKHPVNLLSNDRVPRGCHDVTLASLAGKLRRDGLEEEAMTAALIEIIEKRFDDFGSDYKQMAAKVSHSICKKPVGQDTTAYFGSGLSSNYQPEVQTNEVQTNEVQTNEVQETKNPFALPESIIIGRLGDIYNEQFKPNGFPIEMAFPSLIAAASVRVPTLVNLDDVAGRIKETGLIVGDDPMVNFYVANIGPFGGGKSSVAEWACRALNIFNPLAGPRYLEGKFGSTEMMLKYLKNNLSNMKHSFLINPDEWAFMFRKAGVPNSSFTTFMTTSFYRRAQVFEVGNRVGLVQLNHALSFIGGIVEDEFDSVFTAESLGGLHDRFTFGYCPGWMWDYRPHPFKGYYGDEGWNDGWSCCQVTQDNSVFEVTKKWKKDSPNLGRVAEIIIRAATVMASLDGQPIVTGADVERLLPWAWNQLAIRTKFPPNPGENPDAIFANAVMNWLAVHGKEWVTVRDAKNGVGGYESKLGPRVAEGSLAALARSNRVDLWMPHDRFGKVADTPADWKGKRRPASGLIRLSRDDD